MDLEAVVQDTEIIAERLSRGPARGNSRHREGQTGSVAYRPRWAQRGGKVDALVSEAAPYALSFTSGALLLAEASVVIPVYLQLHDWSRTGAAVEDGNLLQARTRASSHRRLREITQRLATMTNEELEFTSSASSGERVHMLWAAACRRYLLIGEFAEEVLRERFLTLAETVTHDDFDAFLLAKAIWHDEIAELKESTTRKLRGNVFRMLVEAGLLGDDGRIIPALLSERVAKLMDARTPSDLRFFPVRQAARGTKV